MYYELSINGKAVGSDKYFDEVNHRYLNELMPKNRSRCNYYNLYCDILTNIEKNKYQSVVKKYGLTQNNVKTKLKKVFEPLCDKILKDINKAKDEDYIDTPNAVKLKFALNQLD